MCSCTLALSSECLVITSDKLIFKQFIVWMIAKAPSKMTVHVSSSLNLYLSADNYREVSGSRFVCGVVVFSVEVPYSGPFLSFALGFSVSPPFSKISQWNLSSVSKMIPAGCRGQVQALTILLWGKKRCILQIGSVICNNFRPSPTKHCYFRKYIINWVTRIIISFEGKKPFSNAKDFYRA